MTLSPIACSFALKEQSNGRIQLFPYGRFTAIDGRGEELGGWYVDETNGYQLAEQINLAQVKPMIDYEHQTLFIQTNGQGNPAAGWIIQAEYIDGEGLFADVEWTEKAQQHIKAKEYRYISPYFLPAQDGAVVQVINAALTNRPALHQLHEAIAASQQSNKEKTMLALLRDLFGLPQASEDEIKQKLTALSQAKGEQGIALSDVYSELNKQTALAAQVTAQTHIDLTQYVPLSEMKKVQQELVTLTQSINQDKVNQLVEVALSEGRLLPSQKEWAINLGQKDLQALSDYLAVTTVNPALTSTQTQGKAPEDKAVALSEAEKVAAKALGLTEAEFIQEHYLNK